MTSFIRQLFVKTQRNMVEFTQEKITELVKGYIRETLANDEKLRAMPPGTNAESQQSLLEGSAMKVEEAESLIISVDNWLQNQDHSLMHPVADKIIRAENAKITTGNATYNVLSRDLLKAFKSVFKVRVKRSKGDYNEADEELIPSLKVHPRVVPHAVEVKPKDTTVKQEIAIFSEVQGGGRASGFEEGS